LDGVSKNFFSRDVIAIKDNNPEMNDEKENKNDDKN
jgi:hypothetical protein